MRERHLNESWERTVERETGGDSAIENADVELYFNIQESCQSDEQLREAMSRLDQEIADYAVALIQNEKEWLQHERGSGVSEAIEASDRHRRILHDALIDRINQLSRLFRAKGLDNRWRNVLGLDRKRIAKWAMTVTRFILRKEGV